MSYVDDFELDVDISEHRLHETAECTMLAFVGAGGKTTTMFRTARELSSQGMKVLVATTTMIFVPKPDEYDHLFVLEQQDFHTTGQNGAKTGSITVMGSRINEDGKLVGVKADFLNVLRNKKVFDFILVEADGSKRMPIKAPAKHEPVVPSLCSRVVGVIGMDCLGKEIGAEHVHRPELFCGITESVMGDVIDFQHILKLIENPEGLFRGTGKSMQRYVLLNKVKENHSPGTFAEMRESILKLDAGVKKVIFIHYDGK